MCVCFQNRHHIKCVMGFRLTQDEPNKPTTQFIVTEVLIKNEVLILSSIAYQIDSYSVRDFPTVTAKAGLIVK